jgi:hypothetical protein
LFRILRGSLSFSHVLIFAENNMMPAVVRKLSCKPISAMLKGFISSKRSNAAARDVGGSSSLFIAPETNTMICMTQARTADGAAPVISTKKTIAGIATIDAAFRFPKTEKMDPARKETCIPDIDIICDIPATDNEN